MGVVVCEATVSGDAGHIRRRSFSNIESEYELEYKGQKQTIHEQQGCSKQRFYGPINDWVHTILND